MSEMLLKLLLSNAINQIKGGRSEEALKDLEIILRGLTSSHFPSLRLDTKPED